MVNKADCNIPEARANELLDCFWAESNDPETQEWRDDLSSGERNLVDQWDRKYATGVVTLAGEILKHETKEGKRE